MQRSVALAAALAAPIAGAAAAAPAGGCAAQLHKDCPGNLTYAACAKCAQGHTQDLTAAGCTRKGVGQLCRGGAPPGPPAPPAGGDMSKYLVDGTHCLDGSSAGYFYSAGSKQSTTWVIFLQGGGACYTEDDCAKRAQGYHGSSKRWAATMQSGELLSRDATQNPDFYDANHVFVPYCTGDTHKGTRNTTSPETWGLYFSGHNNLAAIVGDLLGTKGMSSAASVLLTGNSAGGVGTFYNVDWLAERLGAAVTVKGAPNAGWFFPGALPSDFPGQPWYAPSNYTCFAAGQHCSLQTSEPTLTSALWQPYFHPACTAAQKGGEEWHCGTVHVLYPYIKAPLFVLENQYDTNQLYTQEGCPRSDGATQKAYISMYGQAMRNSTQQVVANTAKKDGIFHPSCLQHGVGPTVEMQGQSWIPLVGDWFFGRDQLAKYHQLVDDCAMTDGLPCNTGCPGLTSSADVAADVDL